jgi:hypothetical protein
MKYLYFRPENIGKPLCAVNEKLIPEDAVSRDHRRRVQPIRNGMSIFTAEIRSIIFADDLSLSFDSHARRPLLTG